MSLSSLAAPSAFTVWWMAIRPRTLTMAIVPVVAGALVAWHEAAVFRPLAFLAALVSALAIQIGTNLLNDASDCEAGLDRPGRLGPPRVSAEGLATPVQVKRAAKIAFTLAALAGLVCIAIGGVPIAAVGLASLLAGWAYSRGPAPISASAFGEVFVLLFFGVVAVGGTHYLMLEHASLLALLTGVAVGLPAAAVLLVNNHRDRAGDALNGRRTLAIRLGIGRTRALYVAMLVSAGLGAASLALLTETQAPLLALLALPVAAMLGREIHRLRIDGGLNELLARTAGYQLLLLALIALGLLW